MHISWGTGFIYGIFKFGLPKIKIGTIIKDLIGRRDNRE
jgi:hypothetical protein